MSDSRRVAWHIVVAIGCSTFPIANLGAQSKQPGGDSFAIVTTALESFATRISGHRRFISNDSSGYVFPRGKLQEFAVQAKASVASSTEAYQTCDTIGRCRIAPDAELITVEHPQLIGADHASVRVVVEQGTNIKRMPVATRSYRYIMEKRAGKWVVMSVATVRQ